MNTALTSLALIGNLGTGELIVILVIGLLIFGRRLPEVGRSLGKGIVEFKKGLKGVEDEIEEASSQPRERSPREFPRPGEDDRRVSRGDGAQKVTGPQDFPRPREDDRVAGVGDAPQNVSAPQNLTNP